ncbi:MAG: carbon-nitrogen hydrolase family protein [Betaproteobacteria bacterium]|nr:carbon-nitrogen hydrolase family protein [Betaproteobacteria bacterium]
MKVAALQMVSTPRVDANLRAADRLLAEARAQGAELALLPEYFCVMGLSERDKVALRERPGDGPIHHFLADAARAHGLAIIGGTVPLECGDSSRVFNTSLVFSPRGDVLARYDKIHRFRFERGDERYDESRTIAAGTQPVVAEVQAADGVWSVGLSICYDLRFPELYRALGACDVVVVPSAFTFTTGQAHWATLLAARAIENQCYVVAAAQGSGADTPHDNGRRTWGHSCVIGPWGELIAQCEFGEAVVMAELTRERLAQVRAQLPALDHRVL